MDLVEVVSNGLLWSLKNNMNLETLRINILDFLNNKFVIEKIKPVKAVAKNIPPRTPEIPIRKKFL